MLPSKFFEPDRNATSRRNDESDDDDDDDEHRSGGGGGLWAAGGGSYLQQARQQQQQQLPPPLPGGNLPLGVTGIMCEMGSLEIPQRGRIQYRIFRPRQLLLWDRKPPLVVVHGGPMIPCNYLLPLAHCLVDRALVFYDQLGCGQSPTPLHKLIVKKDNDDKSKQHTLDLAAMVHDLHLLLQHWKFQKYHLLGHSFGGILAFEYFKAIHDNKIISKKTCMSLVMASTPTSTNLVQNEVTRLQQEIQLELKHEDEENQMEVTKEIFRSRHECRVHPTPFPLMDAYQSAGPVELRGLQAIGSYQAEAQQPLKIPALLLQGEHDFVTEQCMEGWTLCFQESRRSILSECSHYGILENETLFGKVVGKYLQQHDP